MRLELWRKSNPMFVRTLVLNCSWKTTRIFWTLMDNNRKAQSKKIKFNQIIRATNLSLFRHLTCLKFQSKSNMKQVLEVEETSAGVSTGHMWKETVIEVKKINRNCLFRVKKQISLKMKSNQTFPFMNPKNTQENTGLPRERPYQQRKSPKTIITFQILTSFEFQRISLKWLVIFFSNYFYTKLSFFLQIKLTYRTD